MTNAHQPGILVKAGAVVVPLIVIKVLVHQQAWEWITSLSLLSALLGGVVFTLAILLAATLADFKESERIVGELASQIRSLHWDLAFIVTPAASPKALAHLRAATRLLIDNLRRGKDWESNALYVELDALSGMVHEAARAGVSTAQVRTVQVWLANIARIADRIGVIMETSFVRAGYILSAVSVAALVVALVFARLQPFSEGLFMFSFASFLLVGLFLLIWDLDNPFSGDAKIDARQLDELERLLAVPTKPVPAPA
jgi:hypothetical protein